MSQFDKLQLILIVQINSEKIIKSVTERKKFSQKERKKSFKREKFAGLAGVDN